MGSACSSCSNVMWSGVYIQYFVLYVPRVGYCVCCDISAGLIRPADLYATYYMGLFFDMRVSTSLNPFFSVPLHKPSVYRVSQEEISLFYKVIISVILNKKLCMYTYAIPNAFRDTVISLYRSLDLAPKIVLHSRHTAPFRFLFMGLDEG